MIKVMPRFSQEDNSVYEFKTGTDSFKYNTKIVIDELNDELLLNESLDVSEYTCCTCKDYGIRKRHCKHIKEAKELLKQMNINFRESDEQK